MTIEELEEQILETWRAHNRIMLFTLEHTPEEAFSATLSTRGGRDVAAQFAHIHSVRLMMLDSIRKSLPEDLISFGKGEIPDKATLLTALTQSGDGIEKYLRRTLDNNDRIKRISNKAVPMLGYMISHEAQHRGSILLTMKKSGHKLPDELKWGVWEWDKFMNAAQVN